MIIRIRTQLGTWRLQNVKGTDTISTLKSRIESEHNTVLKGSLYRDLSANETYDDNLKVGQAGLKNGDMIFVFVDETKTGVHENAQVTSKTISKSGDIVLQNYDNISNSNGFRPGMLPLKSMKKHWTLSEFISLDEQFEFRLKAPDKSAVALASVDKLLMEEFVTYMKSYNFQRMRWATRTSSSNSSNSSSRSSSHFNVHVFLIHCT
jgi:hypothetical protein